MPRKSGCRAIRKLCCLPTDGYVLEEARRSLAAKAADGLRALDAVVAEIQVAEAHPADAGQGIPSSCQKRTARCSPPPSGSGGLISGDRSHFGALYGKRWPASGLGFPAAGNRRSTKSRLLKLALGLEKWYFVNRGFTR